MAQTKREALLRAAYDTIAEHGVRGLRVEEVAARADVAVSLVYYHFTNRAGLLRASMEYADATSTSTMWLEKDTDRVPAITRIERALLGDLGTDKASRDNDVVWLEILASAVFDDELRELVSAEQVRWVSQVAAAIEDGQRDGSVSPDVTPAFEARLLTTLLDGAILEVLSGSVDRREARALVKRTVRERLAPST